MAFNFGNQFDDLNVPPPATPFSEKKYQYALEQVIYYSLVTPDVECLSYYKDGSVLLTDNAPAALRFLASEYENMDFHERFWKIREWDIEQKRINSDLGYEFEFETMEQFESHLGLTFEELELIDSATINPNDV